MKKYIFLLVFALLLSGAAFSQVEIGLNAVGGKLGLVMPEDPIDNTLGFGVVVDLGTITPKIFLNGFIEYWGKTYDVGYIETSFSEFIFGATAKYYFALQGQFKPYAGAGLGFVLGKFDIEYKGPSSPYYVPIDGSESETDIGFHFCGGADYEISDQMTGFGELKYHTNGIDFFSISVGVLYKLGN